MSPQTFLNTVIRPALRIFKLLPQPCLEQLLLGTAIQESGLRNIKQEGGPALGYFQDEPADHDDLWKGYIERSQGLTSAVKSLLPEGVTPSAACLIPYPIYAAAICRLHYSRIPARIPLTLGEQAAYYKRYYNSPEGAATPEEYLRNWARFVPATAMDNWVGFAPQGH
jgi:hypothetical protein